MEFLKEAAEYLWQKYGKDIRKVCIILPNRRGGLYLKKHLAGIARQTIWAPRILSIEELIGELSGFLMPGNFNLLFDLYAVHKNIEKEKAQPFEEFMNWGQILLQDFSDVDHYLADAEHLYKYLDAAKVMSVWNPDGRPLTDFQKQYLAFFNSMLDYYKGFRDLLAEKEQAYQGMASRYVAENIEKLLPPDSEDLYFFAGFNALTSAEEVIIRYLLGNGKAEILWDADKYYLENPAQEAGIFLRKYREEWKQKEFGLSGENYRNDAKRITVIGVPKQVGQAKMCGEIISGLPKEELERTALVLADENLLMPVLNSIPPGFDAFNITMGFPLNQSSLHTLIDGIFRLHETAQRLGKMRPEQQDLLYFENVLSVLEHPYIISLTAYDTDGKRMSASSQVAGRIRSHNSIFMSSSGLKRMFDDLLTGAWEAVKAMFLPWEQGADAALKAVACILEALRDHFIREKESAFDLEFVYQFACLVKRLRTLFNDSAPGQHTRILRTLFDRLVRSSTLPFYGEPLSGFQVMGVLETRTLDFPNLIMLSVNDDIIPSGRMQQSFIPFDIRSQFKLPTYKDREAIFAYHFYRLLQRSNNIWLLYNAEPDKLGGGERSRFISQLIHELPKHNKAAVIEEKLFTLPPALNIPDISICINKSDDILELLRKKAKSGLAPSALNAYLNCSLKFYFQELIGLRETEEVQETIDAANMGKAVHVVLQRLYTPYRQKQLTARGIDEMIRKADDLVPAAFKELHEGGDFRYGKNLLIMKVASVYINNFLNLEKELIGHLSGEGQKLIIKQIEFPLYHKYNAGSIADCEVVFKGFADRIDLAGNTPRIIDYKTGKVSDTELQLESWDDLMASPAKREKSFQLMMYAFLYHKNNPDRIEAIESGIISFRNLNRGFMPVSIENCRSIDKAGADKFECLIRDLIKQMFDKSIPISQTAETGNCTYCPYRFICYRES